MNQQEPEDTPEEGEQGGGVEDPLGRSRRNITISRSRRCRASARGSMTDLPVEGLQQPATDRVGQHCAGLGEREVLLTILTLLLILRLLLMLPLLLLLLLLLTVPPM